jgi:hypothetical protein
LGEGLPTKAPDAVSWYKPHPETSLNLIERTWATPFSAIIDVGAGESTLADDLLSLEFQNITVLDISETAIDVCKKRMGAAASRVHWVVADVTRTKLAPAVYDIGHDRAVFHFSDGDGTTGLLCQQRRPLSQARRPCHRQHVRA